jgi:hypothetical protein
MTAPEQVPVLHEDDPNRVTAREDGTQVRNLTAEEYAASYADGTPHTIPPDVLAKAIADAESGQQT